jgi:hypothetical protein
LVQCPYFGVAISDLSRGVEYQEKDFLPGTPAHAVGEGRIDGAAETDRLLVAVDLMSHVNDGDHSR